MVFWGAIFRLNLQAFYVHRHMIGPKLKTGQWGSSMKKRKAALIGILLLTGILQLGLTPSAHAWRWDEDENMSADELDVQLAAYRKRVESGMPLADRIVALDRLIKLFTIYKRDISALEAERQQLLADENAMQTVSSQSREKSQDLFQKAMESIRLGQYLEAQKQLTESEHLNPSDKIITEARQKVDALVTIMQVAPTDPNTSDLVRRGVAQFIHNEPSKALNFLIYAQQKNPTDTSISGVVDLVKRTFPNESAEILDARLNLIDQKLQKALEKIYGGEYLVAAKECQEVLDLEPENALALTRLGSVYYAMGQVKQARVYWQQALTLDAKNDVLRSFLSQTSGEADRAPTQLLTYKVEKGDTLQKIAEKVYNDKTLWRRLYDANRSYLRNAYQLNVGQVLVVPQANAPR